jgi:hypothetical protein
MHERKKMAVTRRVVMQRLQRKLLEEGLLLRKARGKGYYLVTKDQVYNPTVDVDALIKEHNCLWPWEVIDNG